MRFFKRNMISSIHERVSKKDSLTPVHILRSETFIVAQCFICVAVKSRFYCGISLTYLAETLWWQEKEWRNENENVVRPFVTGDWLCLAA